MFAKKRRIYELAIQNCFVERRREGLDHANLPHTAIRAREHRTKASDGWGEAAPGTPVSERMSFHRRTALMASRPSRDQLAAPALV